MLCTASIFFSNLDFFSIDGLKKEYRKQNWGMNIMEIMDKKVGNLIRGR